MGCRQSCVAVELPSCLPGNLSQSWQPLDQGIYLYTGDLSYPVSPAIPGPVSLGAPFPPVRSSRNPLSCGIEGVPAMKGTATRLQGTMPAHTYIRLLILRLVPPVGSTPTVELFHSVYSLSSGRFSVSRPRYWQGQREGWRSATRSNARSFISYLRCRTPAVPRP